ncbi:MAG: hypothetical protein NWQ45_06570 [Congregibacter sp.]|nr:hypothetical protein [Congregibacter sp.]
MILHQSVLKMFASVVACRLLSAMAVAEPLTYEDLLIPDQSGSAVSVLGAVDPGVLGHTLMHEHLFIYFWIPLDQPDRWETMGLAPPRTEEDLRMWDESLTAANRDELANPKYFLRNKDAWSLELADTVPEVHAYKALGGSTIVDLPPIESVRDATRLVELSRQTGVNVVVGSAFYIPAWHPPDIDELSIEDLTRLMLVDFVEGMDGTGIKAGIVGEVPADNLQLSPDNNETRILRASARASRLTGAALSLHYTLGKSSAVEIPKSLTIIEEEGLDLSRVVVGHLYVPTAAGVDGMLSLFESIVTQGAYLQFDLLGSPEGHIDAGATLDAIEILIRRGHSARITVSQDIYSKFHLRKFGGEGLSYVHETLLPELRARGVSEVDIRNIIELNPRKLLTFESPQPLLSSK